MIRQSNYLLRFKISQWDLWISPYGGAHKTYRLKKKKYIECEICCEKMCWNSAALTQLERTAVRYVNWH